jgi:hypothetical protein
MFTRKIVISNGHIVFHNYIDSPLYFNWYFSALQSMGMKKETLSVPADSVFNELEAKSSFRASGQDVPRLFGSAPFTGMGRIF